MMDFGVVLQTNPPVRAVVELAKRAEANGFSHVWVCLIRQCSGRSRSWSFPEFWRRRKGSSSGPMVTNPGSRDWTVLASTFATLNDQYGPRTICGMGRGDSALRYVGRKPRTLAEMAEAMRVVKGLVAGGNRRLPRQGDPLPVAGAGLGPAHVGGPDTGPRALDCIGRHADGFILQLADPQILEWTLDAVRQAAAAQGRAPGAVATCVAAPACIGDDLRHQREQLRWFGGMVGNHVADIVKRYGGGVRACAGGVDGTTSSNGKATTTPTMAGPATPPRTLCRMKSLTASALLGPAAEHIAKLRTLLALGADQFAIYLMHDAKEETLDAYGRVILPSAASEESELKEVGVRRLARVAHVGSPSEGPGVKSTSARSAAKPPLIPPPSAGSGRRW